MRHSDILPNLFCKQQVIDSRTRQTPLLNNAKPLAHHQGLRRVARWATSPEPLPEPSRPRAGSAHAPRGGGRPRLRECWCGSSWRSWSYPISSRACLKCIITEFRHKVNVYNIFSGDLITMSTFLMHIDVPNFSEICLKFTEDLRLCSWLDATNIRLISYIRMLTQVEQGSCPALQTVTVGQWCKGLKRLDGLIHHHRS
jgi:hypothetical protein